MHNVGSIFRTADAAGVSKIYLCGYTPAPLDRFNRPVPDIAKVALGAEKSVPWEQREIVELITALKAEGVAVVAVEQAENSIPHTDFKPKKNVALILGSEVGGISSEILKLCDTVIEIPMHGQKESLNVSVVAGIVLYQLIRD
jgi:tRNA G18 (ribose-2'-O)-methylase SpoU